MGKTHLGRSTTDGSAFGGHASSQDTPRFGLGNVLSAVTGDPDASKHPSELGQALCSDPNAPSPANNSNLFFLYIQGTIGLFVEYLI